MSISPTTAALAAAAYAATQDDQPSAMTFDDRDWQPTNRFRWHKDGFWGKPVLEQMWQAWTDIQWREIPTVED
ncbi:MAG: hypothetical protein Q7N50_10750 [Armatimonadota bacterium]|nr:hypothetical protein [Armatimonadota bacterium]